MRLTTTARTHNLAEPMVGRIAFPNTKDRKNTFVLAPEIPESLEGFAGHGEQANIRVRRYGHKEVAYAGAAE